MTSGEQAWCASGMQKNDTLVVLNTEMAHMGDQRRGRLGRIGGVEYDACVMSEEFGRLA